MYPSDASATMIVRSCVPVVNACANVIFWTTDVAGPAKSARRRSCDLRVNEYTPQARSQGTQSHYLWETTDAAEASNTPRATPNDGRSIRIAGWKTPPKSNRSTRSRRHQPAPSPQPPQILGRAVSFFLNGGKVGENVVVTLTMADTPKILKMIRLNSCASLHEIIKSTRQKTHISGEIMSRKTNRLSPAGFSVKPIRSREYRRKACKINCPIDYTSVKPINYKYQRTFDILGKIYSSPTYIIIEGVPPVQGGRGSARRREWKSPARALPAKGNEIAAQKFFGLSKSMRVDVARNLLKATSLRSCSSATPALVPIDD
jgi:hypothetical protein